jgi:hypothetical protein
LGLLRDGHYSEHHLGDVRAYVNRPSGQVVVDRAGSVPPDLHRAIQCSASLGDGRELRFRLRYGVGEVAILVRNQPVDATQAFFRQTERGLDP